MTTKTEPQTAACPTSPTGAHHWIIGAPGADMSGECKHCHTSRAFRPFQDEVGFNNSPKRDSGRTSGDAGAAA